MNQLNAQSQAPRKKFTASEDTLLIGLVEKTGPRNWNTIAKSIPGRNGRQCRDRYMNYLSPSINSEKWTKEEDQKLLMLINQYGTKWSTMAQQFNGRTGSSLKNRWYFRLSPCLGEKKYSKPTPIKSCTSNGLFDKTNDQQSNLSDSLHNVQSMLTNSAPQKVVMNDELDFILFGGMSDTDEVFNW